MFSVMHFHLTENRLLVVEGGGQGGGGASLLPSAVVCIL